MNKKEPIKIGVFNQKGGVGKTTTVINIAGIMAKRKLKILVIDGDPQANTTSTLLMENIAEFEKETKKFFYEEHSTLLECIENPSLVNDSIIKAKIVVRDGSPPKWRGIDVLPSKRALAGIDIEGNDNIIKVIEAVKATRTRPYEYDFIFFDLPPYLSSLSINVLSAVDYVLVPATVDKDSLDGYSELLDTVQNIKLMEINTSLKILGVFLTMINSQTNYDKYMYSSVKESLGEVFIDIPIRWNSYVKQASHFGCPLCWFKRNEKVTRDYELVTDEILRRCGLLETSKINNYVAEVISIVNRYLS